MYLDDCLAILSSSLSSAPPPPYSSVWAQAGFAPGCSVCCGPLFSLHPRPRPALSSVPDTCPHTHPEEEAVLLACMKGDVHACWGWSFSNVIFFFPFIFQIRPLLHMRQWNLVYAVEKNNPSSSTAPWNSGKYKPRSLWTVPHATYTCWQLPLC